MGFNFRKSIKIAPGVKLNISKKGITSVSVGGKGVRLTAGRKAARTTVSLGNGLSYTKNTPYKSNNRSSNSAPVNTSNQQQQSYNSPTPLYNSSTSDNSGRNKRVFVIVGLIIVFMLIISNFVG